MRYWRSITSFFDHPKWGMSLLCMTVCVLIPIVGPLVIIGYLAGVIARQTSGDQGPDEAFDFGRFGDYLSQGWQAFLVSLLLGLILAPLSMAAMLPTIAGVVLMEQSPAAGVALVLLGVALYVLALAATMLLSMPLILRAALTQSFSEGLRIGWAWRFGQRVGFQLGGAILFMVFVGTLLMIAGYACCFVGVYPAMVLLMYAQWHLLGQLHRLHLQRGGEPIPIAPQLLTTRAPS